jgi:type 1 glutamine amidotransferase
MRVLRTVPIAFATFLAIGVASLIPLAAQTQTPSTLLVFSKTAGFRHDSIEAGIAAIRQLGRQHGFAVDATEDASRFHSLELNRYAAVLFLSTTGDVLNREQQQAFEQYIRSGRGYIGVHAAADTEYEWPWYGRLVGGYFVSHDAIQPAQVVKAQRFGDARLPNPWTRTDEWYNYKQFDRAVTVILKLDTKSFKGSQHGDDHPIAWYRPFDGGRSFYTGMGHTRESFAEPLFLEHLLDGIRYSMGISK